MAETTESVILSLRNSDKQSSKEKKEIIIKMVNVIVQTFEDSVNGDLYPPKDIEKIFGIEMGSGVISPSGFTVGQAVYNAWCHLMRYSNLKKEHIINAIFTGKLPELFEERVKKFVNNKYGFNSGETMVKIGFKNIKWNTEILDACRDLYQETPLKIVEIKGDSLSLKLKEMKGKIIGFNKIPNKDNPISSKRIEIKGDPIHLAYGYDGFHGYFLSVFDNRLSWKEEASDEVNSVTEKIGVQDGGGSYFDIHTGPTGFGLQVSREVFAEYIKRYGAPLQHVAAVKNGLGFESD